MKIANSFVTNSSSTSFIISSKGLLTKEMFLNAMGVNEESLLVDIYNNLYKAIRANVRKVPENVSVLDFLDKNGIVIDDENDKKEIASRYQNGDHVFFGDLSDSGDDGGLAEAFYSHESIVVIREDIYFNARNSVY